MNKSNGDTAAPLGVLEEITSRLAALTEEQLVPPSQEREKDAVFVMMAPDGVKRLFALREQLREERRSLSREMKSVADKAMIYIYEKPLEVVMVEMDAEGSFLWQVKERMERFGLLASRAAHFFEIVEQIFWLEVRRQHPDLQEKPVISINSDWSLCWQEGKEDEDIFKVFRIDLSEILLAGAPPTMR